MDAFKAQQGRILKRQRWRLASCNRLFWLVFDDFAAGTTLVPRAALAVFGAVLATACSGPQESTQTPVAADDVDGAVVAAERQLASADFISAPDAKQALENARDRAIATHADAGQRALRNHDLKSADSECKSAQRYNNSDSRVVDLRAKIASARTTVVNLVASSRQSLQKLSGLERNEADRPAWQALCGDLDELALWEAEFPDAAHVRAEAKRPVAQWFVGEARALRAKGQVDAARAALERAAAVWSDSPDVAALTKEMSGVSDAAPYLAKGDDLAAQGQFALAVQAYREATVRDPASDQAKKSLATALRQQQRSAMDRARQAAAAGRVQDAIAAAQEGAKVQTGDLQADAEAVALSRSVGQALAGWLYDRFATAQKKKLPGAAWVYGREIQVLVGSYRDVDPSMVKLEAQLVATSAFRLQVVSVVPPKKDHPPEGLAAALHQALQGRLDKALGPSVQVTTQAGQGKLLADISAFSIKRSAERQERRKPYLDHTVIVDNPAYGEAKGKEAAALTALNVGLDALRPVQDQINDGEKQLFQTKQQLAEIEAKVSTEDAAWYKTRPSPCPDKSLRCPQTRASQRWAANLDYYRKNLDKFAALLTRLEPERLRLQAEVEAKQKLFDEAEKAVTETPVRRPSEVWVPYDYVVWQHQLNVSAKLTMNFQQKGAEALHGEATLLQSRSDVATDKVLVKGQMLEPDKPASLPTDPTVVLEGLGQMLDQVLPPVFQRLAHHADPAGLAALEVKDELQRIHQLAIAARGYKAMTPELAQKVLADLLERTGWNMATSEVDAQRLHVTDLHVPSTDSAPAGKSGKSGKKDAKKSK